MKPILKMVIIVAITGLVTSACKPEATETPPPTASYQARTASFDVVENDVRMRLSEDEEYSPAATGQTLPVGGQARTGDESSAQLDLMPDGAILRLGPGTEFTLTELAEGDDDFFARLQMEAGKLWIILTGGELEVETASGTASVRGSLLGIYFFPDIPLLTATCLEGFCAIQNAAGRTEFGAGQAVDVTGAGSAPSSPRPMTDEEYQDWFEILRDIFYGPRLGDYAWLDINLNGVQDEDEEGLDGVMVFLFDSQDNLLDQTSTDEDGYYSFPFLASGTYYLYFEVPGDYVLSPMDMVEDDSRDSDVDPITGLTAPFEYIAGNIDTSRDAGFIPFELAPTSTPTETPAATPTFTPKPPPPPCGCYTPGVTFQVVSYDGSPGWSDCGQATACHSLIGDQIVASGAVIGSGGSCSMKVICP